MGPSRVRCKKAHVGDQLAGQVREDYISQA